MPGRSHTSLSVFGIAGLILTIAIIVVALSLGLKGSSPGTTTSTTLGESAPATTPTTASSSPSQLSLAVESQCDADTRVVDTAIAAFEANNSITSEPSPAVWHATLVAPSTGTLQAWPSSKYYIISVAGPGSARDSGDGVTPQNGDVLLTITLSGKTYDATQNPTGRCSLL